MGEVKLTRDQIAILSGALRVGPQLPTRWFAHLLNDDERHRTRVSRKAYSILVGLETDGLVTSDNWLPPNRWWTITDAGREAVAYVTRGT